MSNSKNSKVIGEVLNIGTDDMEFSHEAKIGKISDEAIFYLMTRGLSEEEARAMIVRGFASPISFARF